ncbi:unnamed protein product [Thelazia callipaeda]|uniref:LAM_G_DOMAIN domain-containing protein n=1 Tax=Thelazia callipaeda TaxID=103827 RepID=A0A0N5CT49_THECL|nr:unnamed protein product [Thelazia callipaeda]
MQNKKIGYKENENAEVQVIKLGNTVPEEHIEPLWSSVQVHDDDEYDDSELCWRCNDKNVSDRCWKCVQTDGFMTISKNYVEEQRNLSIASTSKQLPRLAQLELDQKSTKHLRLCTFRGDNTYLSNDADIITSGKIEESSSALHSHCFFSSLRTSQGLFAQNDQLSVRDSILILSNAITAYSSLQITAKKLALLSLSSMSLSVPSSSIPILLTIPPAPPPTTLPSTLLTHSLPHTKRGTICHRELLSVYCTNNLVLNCFSKYSIFHLDNLSNSLNCALKQSCREYLKIFKCLILLLIIFMEGSNAILLSGAPDSYARYPKWVHTFENQLSLDFRTKQNNALLLYTDDGGVHGNFYALTIAGGKLQLDFRLKNNS